MSHYPPSSPRFDDHFSDEANYASGVSNLAHREPTLPRLPPPLYTSPHHHRHSASSVNSQDDDNRPSAQWNRLGHTQQPDHRPATSPTAASVPVPPPHRYGPSAAPHTSSRDPPAYHDFNNPSSTRRSAAREYSTITPDAENLSHTAPGGGLLGVALGIADAHPRASGVQALRDIDLMLGGGHHAAFDDDEYEPEERQMDPPSAGPALPYEPQRRQDHLQPSSSIPRPPPHSAAAMSFDAQQQYPQQHHLPRPPLVPMRQPRQTSYGSGDPFGDGHYPAPHTPQRYSYQSPGTPSQRQSYHSSTYDPPLNDRSPARTPRAYPADSPYHHYTDNPYNRYSNNTPYAQAAGLEVFDPNDIADDGDDGLDIPQRRSVLNMHRPFSRTHHNNNSHDAITAAELPAAAVGGAVAGGGFLAKALGSRESSGNYGAVPGGSVGPTAAAAPLQTEKSAWLDQETHRNKRLKWIVGSIIVIVILLAIGGGVAGGILAHRKSSSSSSNGGNASGSDPPVGGGDYNSNTPAVKALLNNPNLRQVFPGMDYTPLNAQYPGCLTVPPNQDNVTMDMAVMSQLTNNVRLYGNDCNQTQMVLHSFQALNLDTSKMKLWLGVWLENNSTTNDRQMAQLWDIIDSTSNAADVFAGVIVGNEVLYRQDLTMTQLESFISAVQSNLTSRNLGSLPVATSDLGDNWDASLAEAVDVVMANVHPFFGGVVPTAASDWTWNFWQTHDVVLTGTPEYSSTNVSGAWTQGQARKANIISEVGWPSQGGNDCGTGSACPNPTAGSVAGIDELNTFMAQFVCDSLKNGTTYFWFEAFDEPWKIIYDTSTDGWEDHWGLFDVDRNLKSGVSIPDCNGQRIPAL